MHEKLKAMEEKGAKLFEMSEKFTLVVFEDEYKGKLYIGVRKFIVSHTYVGFTKQGINIPKELADSVAQAILELDKES